MSTMAASRPWAQLRHQSGRSLEGQARGCVKGGGPHSCSDEAGERLERWLVSHPHSPPHSGVAAAEAACPTAARRAGGPAEVINGSPTIPR